MHNKSTLKYFKTSLAAC